MQMRRHVSAPAATARRKSTSTGERRQHLWRAYAPLWRFARRRLPQFICAWFAMFASTVAFLYIGVGIRELVDGGFTESSAAPFHSTIAHLFAAIVVLAVSTFIGEYLLKWIAEATITDVRRYMFDRALSLHPAYFETMKTADVVSRLFSDTVALRGIFSTAPSSLLKNGFIILGGVVVLMVTSIKLTILAAIAIPFVAGPIHYFGQRTQFYGRVLRDEGVKANGYAEEVINGIKTVQAFTHETVDRRQFDRFLNETMTLRRKLTFVWAVWNASVLAVNYGAVIGLVWLGGIEVIEHRLTSGALVAFVFYTMLMASAVTMISQTWSEIQRSVGPMERITELIRAKSEIVSPSSPAGLAMPMAGHIQFENVTFHYPSRRTRPALADFSLTVGVGDTVALVGPSGAGKTTIFHLLLRFCDADDGAVKIDGIDVRHHELSRLRRSIGIVSQEPVIFSANAWENIRYGRPDASDDEVREAAKAAAAAEFLDRLPQGFNTFLGERGVRLSGGQRQRLAIARAVLRNPPILLLDEATSALDSESELAVQNALDRLSVGRTTLVIAHRLGTVLRANRIIVIDQGRLVAVGSHEELLQSGGLYSRLAALQLARGERSDDTLVKTENA
jgi:ATP-binding cassette, subfamily B, bacterial